MQAGTTLALCGLIWFVQIVHYPLFALVGREEFRSSSFAVGEIRGNQGGKGKSGTHPIFLKASRKSEDEDRIGINGMCP